MPYFSFLPEGATVRDVMLNQPERFLPVCGTFTQDVMRGDGPLSVAEREIIAAFTSALNQCIYCTGAHRAFAVDNGVDPDVFETMMKDVDAADVDEKMKPLLKYVRKLTLDPASLEKADAAAVYDAGWSEQALGDAIAICALFNFYNRLVEGHGIVGSKEAWANSTMLIREQGYEKFLKDAVEQRKKQGQAAE